MTKINRLSKLLVCALVCIAMLSCTAMAESAPADHPPVGSPCACCIEPDITIEPISGVVYDGTEQKIATVTVLFSEQDPSVTVNGETVNPIFSTPGNFVWEIYGTDAGTYAISVSATGLKYNKEVPYSQSGAAAIAPKPVTLAPAAENYFFLYHTAEHQAISNGSLDSLKVVVDGMVGEDVASYTVALGDVARTVYGNLIDVGTYEWTITVAEDSNYTFTAENGTVQFAYLTAPVVDFDQVNWFNAANPAVLKAPAGYKIGSTFGDRAQDSLTGFEDATDGDIVFYLEGADAAWTDAIAVKYNQDTVAPEVMLKASGSYVSSSASDDRSGLATAELKYGDRVLADLKNGEEDRRNFMLTGTLIVVATDVAGNQTESKPIYFSDADGDGLNDAYEKQFGSENDVDFDGDGLTDYFEATSGYSDLTKADTDGDGLNDGEEFALGLKAKRPDSDFDGIDDLTYVRFIRAFGLEKLDLELAMLLLQGNLNRANNLPKVPAAELTLLKDTVFQRDNGLEAEASYSELESGMGKADQLRRYSKNFYLLHFDERDGKAVYLNTANNGDYYIVMADVKVNSLKVTAAYKLPYTKDVGNLSAVTSADGTIVVLAPWANGATTENLLLVDLNAGVQFRFGGVADTVAATRFTLANDGSVLAYVGADKLLHTINMTKEDYVDTEYSGNTLQYNADGQLVTNVDKNSPTGVYHVEQPTIQRVSLVLVADGEMYPIELNARFYYRNSYLHCQAEGLEESEGIRLYNLYKNMNSQK